MHVLLKGIEAAIEEIFVVHQTPLPTAIVIGPPVPLARKIKPLRVPKLITHEAQPAFPAQTAGEESYEFVQGKSTVDGGMAGDFCESI